MRVIGLDVGARRIGVASGDTDTRLAVPVGVVTVEQGNSGIAGVLREAEAREASVIVVGMPYSMSGRVGPQAESVEEFVRLLREAGAHVETVMSGCHRRRLSARWGVREHRDAGIAGP